MLYYSTHTATPGRPGRDRKKDPQRQNIEWDLQVPMLHARRIGTCSVRRPYLANLLQQEQAALASLSQDYKHFWCSICGGQCALADGQQITFKTDEQSDSHADVIVVLPEWHFRILIPQLECSNCHHKSALQPSHLQCWPATPTGTTRMHACMRLYIHYFR